MFYAHTGNDHHKEAQGGNDERGSKVWFDNDKSHHERWNGRGLNQSGQQMDFPPVLMEEGSQGDQNGNLGEGRRLKVD